MMSKKVMSVILALIMSLSLVACGGSSNSTGDSTGSSGSSTPPEQSQAAEKIVIQVGHPNVSEKYDQFQYFLESTSEKLKELSGGTMELDIYGDAVLGSEREQFDAIGMGTQDAGALSIVSVSGQYTPLQVFDMPYMFRSDAELRAFCDDDGGSLDSIRAGLEEEKGIHLISIVDCGARNVSGKGTPPLTVEDFAGLKVRISENAILRSIWTRMGATPTNIAWTESFTAQQQGVFDCAEWPVFTNNSSKFWEICNYYVLTGIYRLNVCFVINNDLYQSFTDEQKAWLDEATTYGRHEQQKMMDEKTAEFFATWEKAGCTVYEFEDQDKAVELLTPVWDEFAAEIGEDVLNGVNARVEEIRGSL